MQRLQAIRKFIEQNPAPWAVSVWTVPKDGRRPDQYTAGCFFMLADGADIPDDGPVVFHKNRGEDGAVFFALQAIGEIEEVDGGIRFAYVNLEVVPEDFLEVPVVTITKP